MMLPVSQPRLRVIANSLNAKSPNAAVSMSVLAVTAGLAGGAGIMSLIPRVRTGAMRPNLLFFGVHKHGATLKQILDPEVFQGLVISDDAAVYQFTHSQKCWAL